MEAPTKVLETTSSYRIEYDPGTNQVNLYSSNNTLLAHVAIQLDHNLNQIILHTHTDDKSGAVGGRGFMAALTMAVLRTVAKYFPTFVSVSMTPAVGAATKGLVSQLCGVLIGKMPLFSGGIYNAPVSASKELRAERKKKGAAKSKENDWDSGMMMETMYELAAIQKMEAKLQTGICILGIGPTTMGNLVGNGQLGAAFGWPTFGGLDPSDWYADASQGSGTLTFMIPMTFILSLFWFL